MNKNAACICTVDTYFHHVENFKINVEGWDSYILNDISRTPESTRGLTYTEQEVRENLNFPHQVSKLHYWNSYGNRNIIWFYAHFRMLNFYLKYPNYEYYWFFDDDVIMKDWDYFITETSKSDSDFISYFIFKEPNAVNQPLVPYMDTRSNSGLGWFNRFPGDMDTLPPLTSEIFGSFFPTTRYSNRAMKTLLKVHDDGYFGYGEGFVPTVLNLYKLKIETLIKSDNTSDLFDVDVANILHKGGRINWEWI